MARPKTVSAEQHREQQIARQRLWRQQNPEKVKAQSIARNMKKKQLKAMQVMAAKANEESVTVSEHQLLYLSKHRSLKRSVLAKNLGVTKLQLFVLLEKYGGGIKC